MSNPLLEKIKSILAYEETDVAPSLHSLRQITATSATQTTVTSADLSAANDYDYVFLVLEALNGNCKGQMVLVTEFVNGTDTATVTPFAESIVESTQFRVWDFNIPSAACTATSLSATVVESTIRTEADDHWNGQYLLCVDGVNEGEMRLISDWNQTANEFTVATAFSNLPVIGDAYVPVVAIQPSEVSIGMDGGTVIEREIVNDTLDPEGIIVGAMSNVTAEMSLEIKGQGSEAGQGSTAVRPPEAGLQLSRIFTEANRTGDLTDSGCTTTIMVLDSETQYAYSAYLVNGEAYVPTTSATPGGGAIVPSGHLTNAPATGDEVFAGTTYTPQDTGHGSVGFFVYQGGSSGNLAVITGAMPSLGMSLEGDTIGKFNLSYKAAGGFFADSGASHSDVYDTTAPLAVKSNVNRVLLDGVELEADVLSITAELLGEPTNKAAAFGAFENSGGQFYTNRVSTETMEVYFADASQYHKFRSTAEQELLIQVGSVAGNAFCLWANRAQQVVTPEIGNSEDLMTQTLTFRLLRPTTAGMPAYTFTHL